MSALCVFGTRSASNQTTVSEQVSCMPATKNVSSGIAIPRVATIARTRESLAMIAKALAFGPPRPPPQAPQS